MLASSPTVRPATSDFSFFSKSKNSKSSASPTPSPVVVTTRVVAVPRPQRTLATPSTHASTSRLSSNSPPRDNLKRKELRDPSLSARSSKKARASPAETKVLPKLKCRGESSTPSSASEAPTYRDELEPRALDRTRRSVKSSTPSSSDTPTCFSTPATTPEPTSGARRSPSVPALPLNVAPIPRPCSIEENGTPGQGFLSCEMVVKSLMHSYKAHFHNPRDPYDKSFDPHPTDYPVVELEYPNSYSTERFVLLAPKDKDHYDPIMCLEKTLGTIVEYYLTPEQQALFGPKPDSNLLEVSRAPSPTLSRSPSPSHSSNSSLTSLSSVLTSLSSESSPPLSVNHLCTLRHAIRTRDGPRFLTTMHVINSIIRSFKYPPLPSDPFAPGPSNCLKEAVKTWTPKGIPEEVSMRIVDEAYQRCVGPHVRLLNQYEAFSSEVYGELMPSFISGLITATGLNPDSLFLDLGSGVGNVVMQASLQSGCRSYGIEVMPAPAKIARNQLEQFSTRCRMWGVSTGKVELEEGDMMKSQRLNELMKEADVVLINNKVFHESLNESLKPKFLDLKPGAIVVSLKPFIYRMSEHNKHEICAIFDVKEWSYSSGSVSWGISGGSCFLHRVDRAGLPGRLEKLKSEPTSRASSRSSRRR